MPVPLGRLIDVLSEIGVPGLPTVSSGMMEVTVPPWPSGVDPLPRVYAASVRRSPVSASYCRPVDACDERFSGKRPVALSPV